MSNLIAVTIGDIKGIGIQLLIQLWSKNKSKKFVLFCNISLFKKYIKKHKINLKLNIVNRKYKTILYKSNYFNIYSYVAKNNAENTYRSILFGYKECKKKNFIGILTLPLRKDLIIKHINRNFVGHTELFEKLDNKISTNMILYHKEIIISVVTTHVKLKSVSAILKKKNFLYNKIYDLNLILKKDFNISKPQILISGLNPHAGENGELGNEENEIIKPIIKKIKRKKINITGPSSADSMLISKNLKKFDCFVFIYHDQGLIPFKYISQFTGVNYTGNLEIIRTSPDHGTAYNLVGKKNVSNNSLINSFKLINKISINRKKYDKSKKITKSKFSKR